MASGGGGLGQDQEDQVNQYGFLSSGALVSMKTVQVKHHMLHVFSVVVHLCGSVTAPPTDLEDVLLCVHWICVDASVFKSVLSP